MRRGRGAPRVGLICALAVGAGLTACGGTPPEPTWQSSSGVAVWVMDGVTPRFDLAAVERALELTSRAFPERWPAGDANRHAHTARIFLVPGDYELGGRAVAGHVDPASLWMKVVVHGDEGLSDTALVHETVHYLDLATVGATDDTHESWKGHVFDSIERVRATLRAEEEAGSCLFE